MTDKNVRLCIESKGPVSMNSSLTFGIAVLLLVAGCASDSRTEPSSSAENEATTVATVLPTAEPVLIDDTEISSTASQTATAEPVLADDTEIGLTADEAEATDVLTGDFDMLLTGPQHASENAAGCLVIRANAENVGQMTDTYRLEVDTGRVVPSVVSLGVGERAEIVVEICDSDTGSFTLDAFSDGLGGALIGQLVLA